MMRDDERGFTLVELLLTVAMLGVVMVPLSAAFVVGLRSSSDAATRLTDSRAAQITAAFFARDVQGAADVRVGSPSCGSTAGSTPVVTFVSGADVAPPVVTYQVEMVAGQRTLIRNRCSGAAVTNRVATAHGVVGVPQITCTPSCSAPTTVSMHVTQASTFSFDVRGTSRSR